MPARAQGQIWWANLPEPEGWRPVLLLSRTDTLERRLYVTVAPLSRTARGLESEVPVGLDDGLPRAGVVLLENLFTVEHDLLVHYVTTLTDERMDQVWDALHFALDMPY